MKISQLKGWILDKLVKLASDKMHKRGYDGTAVSKVNNKIKIYSEEMVRSDKSIVMLNRKNLAELVDDIIDYTIEDPKYAYDEDFVDPEQKALPSPYPEMAIPPGSRVSIDALKEWIIQTKINSDSVLQAAAQADFLNPNREGYFQSALERAIDSTAFRVARKMYYVGRKPASMTPEEWDAYIIGKKPLPGSYSSNETWSGREFPYGNQYTYRQGPVDDTFAGDVTDPIYKGWTKAGYE